MFLFILFGWLSFLLWLVFKFGWLSLRATYTVLSIAQPSLFWRNFCGSFLRKPPICFSYLGGLLEILPQNFASHYRGHSPTASPAQEFVKIASQS